MTNKIYIAPMVGRTDKYFRALIRAISNNYYLYTEMITCDSFLRTSKQECKLHDYEKGTIIQLAGSDPSKFEKCAKLIKPLQFLWAHFALIFYISETPQNMMHP